MKRLVFVLVGTLLLGSSLVQACFASPNDDLLAAVMAGDSGKAHAAIKAGADANFVEPSLKMPMLFVAIGAKSEPVVEQLLADGANPNVRVADGNGIFLYPLHFAAQTQNLPLIDALLKHGADLAVRDNNGSTPLIVAASSNKTAVVARLLKAGADANQKDDMDRSGLHWAALFDFDRVGEMLIKAGADVNAVTKDGKTALGVAMDRNSTKMAARLKAAGAKS